MLWNPVLNSDGSTDVEIIEPENEEMDNESDTEDDGDEDDDMGRLQHALEYDVDDSAEEVERPPQVRTHRPLGARQCRQLWFWCTNEYSAY